MKRSILIILGVMMLLPAYPQNRDELQLDKLLQTLKEAKADSTRALTFARLAEYYRGWKMDSCYYYGEKALTLSRTIDYHSGEAKALSVLSNYYFLKDELPKGLELGLDGLRVARKHNLIYDEASLLIRIANVYANLRDFQKALAYYHQAIAVTEGAPDRFFYGAAHWRMGDAFAQMNEVDSAIYYGEKSVDIAKKMGNQFIQQGVAPTLGFAYGKKGYDSLALHYLRSSNGSYTLVMRAIFFKDRKQYDSALYYANLAFQRGQTEEAATLLSELYESNDPTSSLKYLKIAIKARESIYGAARVFSAKAIEIEEQELENKRRLEELALQNKIRITAILGGLLLVVLIATFLFRNYKKVQRVNVQLEKQKQEINQALTELKQTQSQLIQSEKMASLGELTAGIAHEIQNPLNFVNNFSEVSNELIKEIQVERHKTKDLRDESIEEELLNDIAQNLEKINHHGKRADAIVKGMLQHSRTSSGKKEPTDINALCDEYLRLAYHGYRAKDKSFNAKFETHLDPTLPKINVVSQDIGRVILNLINNAFYAVSEKSKVESKKSGLSFEPTVTVLTKNKGEKIEISVKDNGSGIPDSIKEKIFQPFFTTKPTGQGTGLGLSLAYDIVTKGHGGELKFETREEEGTKFIIIIPNIFLK